MSGAADRPGVQTEPERQAQATKKYHQRLKNEDRCRHCKTRAARLSWWCDDALIYCGLCALVLSKQKEFGNRTDPVALAWRALGGVVRAIKNLNTAASQIKTAAETLEGWTELQKRRKSKVKKGAGWLQ